MSSSRGRKNWGQTHLASAFLLSLKPFSQNWSDSVLTSKSAARKYISFKELFVAFGQHCQKTCFLLVGRLEPVKSGRQCGSSLQLFAKGVFLVKESYHVYWDTLEASRNAPILARLIIIDSLQIGNADLARDVHLSL